MKFTLCIPAHNEEKSIATTLQKIAAALGSNGNRETCIVVAENASSDRTAEIVEKINLPSVSLKHITEAGKGRAIRETLRISSADINGFTDADLSVEPSVIPSMIALIENKSTDLVVGSRFHSQTKSDRGTARSLSSRIFNLLGHIIVGVQHTDTQCPVKIMNTKALHELLECRENGYFMDLEFIRRCEKNGVRIMEVPIVWRENFFKERESKISLFSDGIKAIVAMFRIRNRVH